MNTWRINVPYPYDESNIRSFIHMDNDGLRYEYSLQIQQQAEQLYVDPLDFVDSAARDLYLGSCYGTAFELQRGLGVGRTMHSINGDGHCQGPLPASLFALIAAK